MPQNDWEPVQNDWTPANDDGFEPVDPPQASWGDTLGAIPEQIRGGAEQAAGGILQAAAAPAEPDPLTKFLPGPARFGAMVPGMLKKAGQAIAGEENVQAMGDVGRELHDLGTATIESATPENQSFWQKAVSTAGTSAGTMVPAGLAAFITKQPGLVAGSFGAQEFGRAYGDAKAKGLDDVQATRHATASGLIEGGTEYLPAKQLFKAGSGPFKRLVNFMARELPGENIAELGQKLSERINGLDDEVTAQEIIDTVKLTSAATLIGGSAQTLAAEGLDRISRPPTELQAPPQPEGPTIEDIAQAEGADLDAMVEEFLTVPDVEAFNEEIAAAERESDQSTNQQVTEITPENTGEFADARRSADRPGETDRRTDPKRAVFDSLPPEQRDILLRSDVIPSLPSKRAFDFHMEENPDSRVMFLDFDDFKAVNDKLGEKETDRAILAPSGELMQEVKAQFPDVKVFHRSGDEFLATGASDQRLEEFSQAMRKRLKNAKLEAILPDGSTQTFDKIEFSYGIDQNEETSRAASKRQKAERKAAGLRTGARDQAVDGQASAGDQVQAGAVNEAQKETTKTEVLTDTSPASLNEIPQKVPRGSSSFVAEAGIPAATAQPEPVAKTHQTDSPEFKKWFGDSKVVDENGKPLVVYHGTQSDFEAFNPSPGQDHNILGDAIYFTPDKEFADWVAGGGTNKDRNKDGHVIPAYLKAERILDFHGRSGLSRQDLNALRKVYPELGDGLIGAPTWQVFTDLFIDKFGNRTDATKKLREAGFDAVRFSEMGGRETIAVFDPKQVKSAIGNRGTFDESDPNILHANPISAVYKGYQRLANAALKRVHDAWGWKMTPLGKLPAQDLYLKERYETLGKIADVESISKRVYETFRGLDAREAELVYEYFTTKDAVDTKLSDKPVKYEWKGEKVESTVRKQAITIKKLINRVGQSLVDRGLLSKESHEKYEDAYLPRVYMKHLVGNGAGRSFAGGKKPSDMGYLKERKDIPKEVRELILGEITDPGYLASKSLGKSMRDLAVLDWFDEIAQNPDWALQDLLVDYKGGKASIFWLKAESARIKEQIPYYKPENQKKAQDIVKQMDAIVQAGEAKMGKVTDAYRQVPDTVQYGRLRGMYIRKEIFNDITGIPGNRDPNAEWWQAPFEYGGIGTKVTQLWKMSKVALNPPTQIRNFISNGILLQLSGVGTHRVLPLMIQAIQEIRQNGKYYRIAKKYGVTGSTFANNELYKIEREWLDLKSRNAGKLSMAQLKNAASIIGDAAGDAYQMSEAIWKTAKIIDAMKREGKDEVRAVLDAQKWLYDYSLVPQTVRYFRNTPIGVPFLTFYYKTLPRMLEVMATAPHRFAPYVAIPALFTAMIASDYDVEPEDVEKLKKALPEWLRDHGHLFFLPYKDRHGRWQAFDFSYLLPWSMFEQTMNNLKEGQVGEAVGTAGVFNGPVTGVIAPIVTGGIDPFTKKPIVDKSDPPADQVASIMNYMWSLGAPSWLTENGAVKKMADAVTGAVDPKTGDPQLTLPQAALRMMGLNLYPIEPEESRRKNISYMGYEIKEIEQRMGERLKDKTLTLEDRRKIREVYQELISEKKEQLKDYQEASKIHPNLKGEPVKDKASGNYDA